MKGCPTLTYIECEKSVFKGPSGHVDFMTPEDMRYLPLTLDNEVPEPTPVDCDATHAPGKFGTETGTGTGSEDGPKETGVGGGDGASGNEGEKGENGDGGEGDKSEDGGEGGDDEGSGLVNAPLLGVVVGVAVGVVAMVL